MFITNDSQSFNASMKMTKTKGSFPTDNSVNNGFHLTLSWL